MKQDREMNIAMLGYKCVLSREVGMGIVVEELSTRLGNHMTCYNRRERHQIYSKEYDKSRLKDYEGVRLKSVFTNNKKGVAAMTAFVFGVFGKI